MPGRLAATRTVSASLLFLMVPQLTGCATWHPVTAPAAEMSVAKPDAIFRLHTRSGTVVDLRRLRVVGDSVNGVIWNPGERTRRDSIRVVALSEVQTVERMSDGGSGAVGVGVLFLLVLAGVAVSAADPCVAAFC